MRLRDKCVRKYAVALLILLVLGPAAALGAQAGDGTAGGLAETCEGAVRFPSLGAVQRAAETESPENIMKAAYCHGYFAGVLELSILQSGMLHGMFCVPQTGFSTKDAIDVFLRYLQDQPRFRSAKGISIVISSLADGLPCH